MSVKPHPQNKIYPAHHLNTLVPGERIHLQCNFPSKKRFSATLIGYDKDNFILVKLADTGNWHQFHRHFYEDNEIIARMFVENDKAECLAFRTSIRWTSTNPCNLLYLHYPEFIEKRDLRYHKRVNTCVMAHMSDGQQPPVKGFLRDVSLGGCCFAFNLPKGKAGIVEKSVTIAAGDNIFAVADIRNQRPISDNQLGVGLQFRSDLNQNRQFLEELKIPSDALMD